MPDQHQSRARSCRRPCDQRNGRKLPISRLRHDGSTRVARRSHQPRDRCRDAREPTRDRAESRAHRRAAQVPRISRARVPGRAHHGNQRQDEHRAHHHAALAPRRAGGRVVHEPAPRARQRADHVPGRIDRRRGARRAAAHGRDGRRRARDRPVVVRHPHRVRRTAGSRISPSTSRSSRSVSAVPGTRRTACRRASRW